MTIDEAKGLAPQDRVAGLVIEDAEGVIPPFGGKWEYDAETKELILVEPPTAEAPTAETPIAEAPSTEAAAPTKVEG